MKPELKYSLLFALLGAVFFLPFLGGVHLFDWDEVNFAEIAREMVVLGDYLRIHVDFIPFTEKPPFFFWLQALSMEMFGIGEYAARLPNAICGIITLVLLFNIGRRLQGIRFGLLWAGAYFGSVLPHLYFKSAIIDPYFNLFIFLGIYYFILYHWKREGTKGIELKRPAMHYLLIGGFIIGMGILTKGPVAYLIAGLTLGVYWILQRFRFYVTVPHVILFTLAALVVMGAWYGIETALNGGKFMKEFTIRQYEIFKRPDAGHKGFPGYHFAVVLLGCFPISILGIRSFFKWPEEKEHLRNFRTWMIILFWVVIILFSIVQSKIVHYSSMTYFPLTFLAAAVADKIIDGKISMAGWMKAGLIIIASIYALVTLAVPIVGQHPEWLEPLFSKDPFALGNLQAEVAWYGYEGFPGLLLLIGTILALIMIKRQQAARGFVVLFASTGLYVAFTLIMLIGNIESYSQRAAIEFFESKSGEDCYVITTGYKSYGQLFYTDKTRPDYLDNPREEWQDERGEVMKPAIKEWLLNGDVDKDVYIATKVHKAKELRGREDMVELYSKNGFVFFKRPYHPPTE